MSDQDSHCDMRSDLVFEDAWVAAFKTCGFGRGSDPLFWMMLDGRPYIEEVKAQKGLVRVPRNGDLLLGCVTDTDAEI